MNLKPDSFFRDVENRNPAVVGKLRFLEFDHLPEHLQAASEPFATLAQHLMDTLPDDPELTLALDLLRQSKDRAVGLAAVQPR